MGTNGLISTRNLVTAQAEELRGTGAVLRLRVYCPADTDGHARNSEVSGYERVAFAWMIFWESTHQLNVVWLSSPKALY